MSRRVGVEVSTSSVHTAIPPAVPGAGTWFVTGITERGPLDRAVLCEGMQDYLNQLGGNIAAGTLYYPLYTAFRSGLKRAYVGRVAGPTPVKASLILKDNSTAPGVNTVRFDAISAGEWGNDLRLAVAAGTRSTTSRITITSAATGATYADIDNIAQDATAAAVVAAFARNRWVRAVSLGTGSGILKVIAATAFTLGAADLASISTAAPYVAALSLFTEDLGAGFVSIPGQQASDITAGIAAHCSTPGVNRLGGVAPAFGLSKSAALAAGEAVLAAGQQWTGMPWPWVSYQDGLLTRWVDPTALMAASRALAHVDGAWQAASAYPYNTSSIFTGTEVALSRSDVNDLATGNMNAIILKNGSAVLRGWYPLTENIDYPSLAVRDLLNVISADLIVLLDEALVWRPVDGHGALDVKATGICTAYLEVIRSAGGLSEKMNGQVMIDRGYVIDVGPDVNTLDTLSRDEYHIHIGIRPAPHSALIAVDIVKVGIGSPL